MNLIECANLTPCCSRFPTGFGYGSMHLQRHQGQIRPVPSAQHSHPSVGQPGDMDGALPQAAHEGQMSTHQYSQASAVNPQGITSAPLEASHGPASPHQPHKTPAEHLTAHRQPEQGRDEATRQAGGVHESVNMPSNPPFASHAHGISTHINAAAEGPSLGQTMQNSQGKVTGEQQDHEAKQTARAAFLQRPGEVTAQPGASTNTMHGHAPCSSGGEPMQLDALVTGISRLSVAAEDASVPKSFSFGRQRGRGRMSRGRNAARRGT